MTDDVETARRRALTFEQAEGREALPSQMALRTTSPQIRSLLWNAVHQRLLKDRATGAFNYVLVGTMEAVMRNYCVSRLAMMADEISNDFDWNVSIAKSNFADDDYVKTYGFIQWLMRSLQDPEFARYVANILKSQNAAYRVVEKDFTLVPIASEQEGEAVLQNSVPSARCRHFGCPQTPARRRAAFDRGRLRIKRTGKHPCGRGGRPF